MLPNVSQLPSILTSIRHPRRRAISIGPQSEADAYETLAYREKRRRESVSSDRRSPSGDRTSPLSDQKNDPRQPSLARKSSKINEYENMMGTGTPRSSPEAVGVSNSTTVSNSVPTTEEMERDDDEREMFSKITKPRVRYDVEVVTKLVVYSGKDQKLMATSVSLVRLIADTCFLLGIAWLAVEVNPILFELVGLGAGQML